VTIQVKICGLSTEASVMASVEGGAALIGFVFHQASPRHVTPGRAKDLARLVRTPVLTCGLFVDRTEDEIQRILDVVRLDMLQLHGAEPPEFCARLRERTGCRVMKAIGVASDDDLRRAERWYGAVDRILFDAKPCGSLPGGTGTSFDWRLLADRAIPVPWMLAGGLNAENVTEAVRYTRAPAVDVSSGVETSPGIKDPAMIRAFLAAAAIL
jgi:phosphoribosylanthranilate isomerase